MDIEDLFCELCERQDQDAWFHSVTGPVNEEGQPTTLMLLLDRDGWEIARCQYSPDPELRGWRVTLWPTGPFFRSLPSTDYPLDLGDEAGFSLGMSMLESVYKDF
ncbi:hypothetical protein [Enterobacter sp. CC120223-11]|uniref:hypothetical protein n=1 Tax=Enterobacter sp. CC120223-11 TaxID=1378073 RepID=UPI000BC9C98D|nr:hypothetical protein [Enterobacter sp. CC120223-11]SNY79792.1 hypothetical protein SAMN02744775_04256 [Enterobacter sp. CC120223-11]